MKKILILFLLLNSFVIYANDIIQVGCFLHDINGKIIKNFPGMYCSFRNNGDRVQASSTKIEYIDSKDNVIWSQQGVFHHQIKINAAEDKVVTLNEISHTVLGCHTRYDAINVYDLKTGKKIKTVDFFEFFKNHNFLKSLKLTYLSKARFNRTLKGYECDTTHVNSISEIPENTSSAKSSIFLPGNWVVNFSRHGIILVFDKELNNILMEKMTSFSSSDFHDVQFSKEGNFLVYVNNYVSQNETPPVTVIAEINPFPEKEASDIIIEPKNNNKTFYQSITGGVQYINEDTKLISIYSETEGYQVGFFDKNWKMYKKFTPLPSPLSGFGNNFQEAKLLSQSTFLKNYKGTY